MNERSKLYSLNFQVARRISRKPSHQMKVVLGRLFVWNLGILLGIDLVHQVDVVAIDVSRFKCYL